MKNTIFLLLFVFGLFACEDDGSIFELSTDGLEVKFTPVAGGAMMYYKLPNNSDIFAVNVRYKNWQGQDVLKTSGYSGDSLLLDGFTRGLEGINARISFVNHHNEESEALDYQFTTLDSAPWSFFDDLIVRSSWNGFQVIYKSPSVVTGMVHIFYLGINPLTQKEDTILMQSLPLSQQGDTLNFIQQQERSSNTIIVRTEDFQGYRVRQEIYPDIDAFRAEQWPMSASDFNDFGMSRDSDKAKTGVKYLFDGELKGLERLIASAYEDKDARTGTEVYGAYLAGPYSYGKPIILDMREQKTPAWIRLYCLYPIRANHAVYPATWGNVWVGSYEDKVPCRVAVYGNSISDDPDDEGWVYLGELNQKPERKYVTERWSYLTTDFYSAPKDVNELETKDPIYVDILFPPVNNTYRYLKVLVLDTFDTSKTDDINRNLQEYFTLQELEVYVKKN
jgi:lipoprotein